MKKREGTHNVSYDVLLSCLHVVTYLVAPCHSDFIMCFRCAAGRTVLTITKKISDSPLQETA